MVKRKKYICGKTIKEVDDKIANLRSQDLTGRLADDKNLTLDEWADVWLTIYKRGKVSQNTYTGYEACVKTHIKPALGNKRLQALKKSELQGLLNTLLQNVNHATAQKSARYYRSDNRNSR